MPCKPNGIKTKTCVCQHRGSADQLCQGLGKPHRGGPKRKSSSTASPAFFKIDLIVNALLHSSARAGCCWQRLPLRCCQVTGRRAWQPHACPAGWSSGAAVWRQRWGAAWRPCPCASAGIPRSHAPAAAAAACTAAGLLRSFALKVRRTDRAAAGAPAHQQAVISSTYAGGASSGTGGRQPVMTLQMICSTACRRPLR